MTKERLEDLCKIKDRTEPFCRYSYYLIMNNLECPYFKYNINVVLSECTYYKLNKFLVENIK